MGHKERSKLSPPLPGHRRGTLVGGWQFIQYKFGGDTAGAGSGCNRTVDDKEHSDG